MTRKRGSFAFGGFQRSLSYGCLNADSIPNSTAAVLCPTLDCEMVLFQNDPDSTANLQIGQQRLGVVGSGITLQPGEMSSWIPVQNLNQVWHKEADENTTLNYMLVGCTLEFPMGFLLLESGAFYLFEDGGKVVLE